MPRKHARLIDRGAALLIFSISLLWMLFLNLLQIVLRDTNFLSSPNGLLLHDFAFFWGGSRLFWLGQLKTVFDPVQFDGWLAGMVAPGSMQPFATWSYPPTMLLAVLPFGLLPLSIAYLSWLLTTFTGLATTIVRTLRPRDTAWIVLASPAALYCLKLGQNGALTATLLIAAVWLVDRRPVMAGAVIGALAIKPHLAIILPFALAAGGYWRTFFAAAGTAAALVAATLPLFGLSAWIGFLHGTMPAMDAQLLHNYGIAPQYAMPTVFVTLQGWGASTRMAAIGQGVSSLLIILLVSWAWRRPDADHHWRNALTCAAPLLATPFGYVYDAIPAMLAVALLAQAGLRAGLTWPERFAAGALWIWPAITVLWTFGFGLPPLGGIVLWAFALCLGWRIKEAVCITPHLRPGET